MGRKSVHPIPTASAYKIIAKAGAERISDNASEYLAEILTNKGVEISKYAMQLAEHAGRKTVKKEDIKLASKQV